MYPSLVLEVIKRKHLPKKKRSSNRQGASRFCDDQAGVADEDEEEESGGSDDERERNEFVSVDEMEALRRVEERQKTSLNFFDSVAVKIVARFKKDAES